MESRRRLSQAALIAACLLGPIGAATAQPADPMASTGCTVARRQLDDALARAGPPENAALLEAARRQAALACLGRAPTGPAQGALSPQPAAVSPIAPMAAPAVTVPPAARPQAVAPPPVPVPRAPAVTSCDSAGCWDSDGRHHSRVGPLLAGPQGLCSLQGGRLVCP